MGRALMPAAAMMELALAAAHTLLPDAAASAAAASGAAPSWGVSRLEISSPIIMPSARASSVLDDLVVLCRLNATTGRLEVTSGPDTSSGGILAAAGWVGTSQLLDSSAESGASPPAIQLLPWLTACLSFPHIQPSSKLPGAVGAISELPTDADQCQASGYLMHPAKVDSVFHLGVLEPGAGAKIPVAVGFVSVAGRRPAQEDAVACSGNGEVALGGWATCAPGGSLPGRRSRSSFVLAAWQGGASTAVVQVRRPFPLTIPIS